MVFSAFGSRVLPLTLNPRPSMKIRDILLSGDVLVVAMQCGLWLYRSRGDGDTVWDLHEKREGSCFEYAYACSTFDPYFLTRPLAESSRYFRHVCVAAGTSALGHSLCVTSTASTFAHHHSAHGAEAITCFGVSPVTSIGSTALLHQSPLAVSVDRAGKVVFFDVERNTTQALYKEEGEGGWSDDVFQFDQNERAVKLSLHGPCAAPWCDWCHGGEKGWRGTPITLCVVLRTLGSGAEESAVRYTVRHLQVLWTTARAVLRRNTTLCSFTCSNYLAECNQNFALSIASPRPGEFVWQVVGEQRGSVQFFHGCIGVPCGEANLDCTGSAIFSILPIGRKKVHIEGNDDLHDCSLALYSSGSIRLVGAAVINTDHRHEVEETKRELDKWFDGSSVSQGEPKPILTPQYQINVELFSAAEQGSNMAGMYLGLVPPKESMASFCIPVDYSFDPKSGRMQFYLSDGTLYSIYSPLLTVKAGIHTASPQPYSKSTHAVQEALPTTTQPSSVESSPGVAYSWSIARGLATAFFFQPAKKHLEAPTLRRSTASETLERTKEDGTPTRFTEEAVKPCNVVAASQPLVQATADVPHPFLIVESLQRQSIGVPVEKPSQELSLLWESSFLPCVSPSPEGISLKRLPGLPGGAVWVLENVEEPGQRAFLQSIAAKKVMDIVSGFHEYLSHLLPPVVLEKMPSSRWREVKGFTREGVFSPGFFEAFYKSDCIEDEDHVHLSVCRYLHQLACSKEPVEVPPEMLAVQEHDRLLYEEHDLLLRQEEALALLHPFEDVLLYQVQERSDSEGGSEEVTFSRWRPYECMPYCDTHGVAVDFACWTANAEGTHRPGVWMWAQKTDEAPLVGSATTVARTLRGWALGEWEYSREPRGSFLFTTHWNPEEKENESVYRRRSLQRQRVHRSRLKKWEATKKEQEEELRILREGVVLL